jgi:hypothetical protein
MAIDPRIALQVRAPDLGGAISQGLQNAGGIQQLQQFKQERASDKLLGLAMGGDNSALERLKVAAPKKYVAARKTLNDLDAGERDASAKSYAQTVVQASGLLAQGNQQGVIDLLTQRSADLEAQGRDNSHTMMGVQLAQAGEWDKLKSVLAEEATGLERLGYLKAGKTTGPRSAAAKEQADLNDGYITQDGLAQYRAGKGTNVNIVNEAEGKGLTEEKKALAKSRVTRFEGLQNNAQSAMDQNEVLSQLETMDVRTGFGEGAKTSLARVFNAAGVDGNSLLGVDAANSQAFNAMTGKLLAEALAAQKGPQTDGDANRMEKTLASLGNEPRANTFIVTSMKAVNERKVEQAAFYEQVLEEDGTLKDADKKWREYKNSTPLLTDNIEDAETGLPMFYYDFKRKTLERNPSAGEDQILDAWRELAK